MTLASGSKLGPYDVVSPLGAGGVDSPLLVKRKPSLRPC